MCCISWKDNSHQLTYNQLSACDVIAPKCQVLSQKDEALSSLTKLKPPEFEAYLVGTNEAQAQGGQHLNDCRAAVALDWVIGLQLWCYALPAYMLPHQGTEVPHHKCILLHLERDSQKGKTC